MVNDALVEAFRHNAWATRKLLRVCAPLDEDQLDARAEGCFGTIIWTLWHMIAAEAGYLARLSGEEPEWDPRSERPPSVEQLAGFNDDLERRWLAFLTRPLEASRTLPIQWDDDTVRAVPVTVPLIQALHHGNEHRSQIATILTRIGIEPPGWGLWEYAEENGRAPVQSP